MSENENSNKNAFILGGVVVIIAALLAFFTFPGTDTNSADVVNNSPDASDKTITVDKNVQSEEIVVFGERAQDVKNAAKKSALAEKANEAAIRAQVNEEMKNSEDTDLNDAE